MESSSAAAQRPAAKRGATHDKRLIDGRSVLMHSFTLLSRNVAAAGCPLPFGSA
jgi:hypothetical protein